MDAIITVAETLAANYRLSRKAGIYLCHKYSGATLKEIGKQFGIKESAVSQTSSRFEQEMERDKELGTRVRKMGARLGL
ncbi:hypothetical protein F6V25_13460 [Oryzomonas japonica]|uniref:Uncharacterized protein n=1 Tax=Oryzomonas japonica TaxID=2603858 RepID=A0A7J4ZPM9_9BACT|nr:hypothetical protein F6V25_13460 [Oryzomonas japonica]